MAVGGHEAPDRATRAVDRQLERGHPMPASDHEGSTTVLAPATPPHQSVDAGTLAPAVDRSAVEHWQRRLDRARATMHLRQPHDER